MFFNSRIAGLVLAAIIALTMAGYLSFLDILSWRAVLSTTFVTFFTAFLFIFLTLEFVIFREINKLYKMLDKLKKKDFKQFVKKIKSSGDQYSRINQELFNFVSKKEEEIDELKKLEVYRREFLADISHELKTPIFAAQGFIHTLLDGAIYDKLNREKFLKKAAKNLDGLEALVQDIILLSQMETGELKMVMEWFDLNQLIKDVFEQVEDKAERNESKLVLDAFQNAVLVEGDPFRIKQVVLNLVDNSIKYGKEKGEVKVVLEKDKEHVLVSIKDDGPGIAHEHLNRIFDRFYRVEKSRSKERGGSGLGLSIVQKVLEAHNSKINVTSKLGKGTTFAFKLIIKQIG
ncbi:MAG TPA: two-component sensor histidine kinase [Cytophagales bacterium]|jgi:two-component system phosphate regulon sensor histidine kinase PhoR|nr:two-component sensor histidine kinase [Cytophagales bacterium]